MKEIVKKVSFPISDGCENMLLIKYDDDSICLVSSYDDGYCYTGTDNKDTIMKLYKELGDMLYVS